MSIYKNVRHDLFLYECLFSPLLQMVALYSCGSSTSTLGDVIAGIVALIYLAMQVMVSHTEEACSFLH